MDGVDVAVEGVVYVAFDDARKTTDLGFQVFADDGLDAIALALGSYGRSGLDDVDAKGVKVSGDPDFFLRFQADARGLFAVSQRGVKEPDTGE